MAPIRISPEREVYISIDPETLGQAGPATESRVVREEVFVLPCGKGRDYIVQVEGFSNAPGGIIETERLTPGHTRDDITLMTSEDPELSGELGVTAVKIDGVLYEAVNVERAETVLPILTAGVLIIKENKVLLVQNLEGSGHITGVYGLPAGRVEPGESEVEAAIRELKEETGLVTSKESLVKLLTVHEAEVPRKDGTTRKFKGTCYKCLNWSGKLKGSGETRPVWVEISELDEINLLPNVKNAVMEGLTLVSKVSHNLC